VSGDRFIRFATAAVVCAVAGFATVVSYSHIYGLGRAHGQDGTAARLLPLSVDGLILAALGEQIAGQIDELADEIAGDDPPGEGYLAKVGRLTAARWQAEEIVMHDYGLLTLGGEDGEPTSAGERPVVVDRDHPSWTEMDAEQGERTCDPPPG
jgi:hypothetical protein